MSIRDDLHIAITCMVIAFTRWKSLVRSQYRPPSRGRCPVDGSHKKRKPAQRKARRVFFCLPTLRRGMKKAGQGARLWVLFLCFMSWSASRAEFRLPHAPTWQPRRKSGAPSRGYRGRDGAIPETHPARDEWLRPWFGCVAWKRSFLTKCCIATSKL